MIRMHGLTVRALCTLVATGLLRLAALAAEPATTQPAATTLVPVPPQMQRDVPPPRTRGQVREVLRASGREMMRPLHIVLVAGPKDPTFKLGGLKAGKTVSARLRSRWLSFAVDGVPVAPAGDPRWRPYRKEDRATLVVDAADRVVDDLDRDLRLAWGDEVLSFR